VYDDVTYVYDDVTYVYDDVTCADVCVGVLPHPVHTRSRGRRRRPVHRRRVSVHQLGRVRVRRWQPLDV